MLDMPSTSESLRPSEEDSRTKKGLISLTSDTLDNPLQFIYYQPETYDKTLRKLSYYGLYSLKRKEKEKKNFSTFPGNIDADGEQLLMLFAEFGTPKKGRKTEGLAVCAFQVTPVMTPEIDSGQTFDIMQFQTTRFQQTPERTEGTDFFHYLGFIKYKNLFLHMVEQRAWRAKYRKGHDITWVSIQKEMRYDKGVARYHVFRFWDGDLNTQKEFDQKNELELQKMRREREEWAKAMGYTDNIVVPDRIHDTHASFAKRIDDIIPDENLQSYLEKIR
jgi:hypothetical protein